MKTLFELIDNEIVRIKNWIKACEGSKLHYCIPEYQTQVEYWEYVKTMLVENVGLDYLNYENFINK